MANQSPKLSRRAAIRTGVTALGGAALTGSALAAPTAVPTLETPLAGGVALVTGAGRGIGRAIAHGLAEAGADVACLDICAPIAGHPYPMSGEAELRETVRLVTDTGRRAHFLKADIRDYAALQRAVTETEQTLGPITILVANAGIDRETNIIDAPGDEAAWRDITEVNILGTANTLRAVLPGMAERGAGSVIATASTFGRSGAGGNPSYGMSKWAIVGLVKSTALQAAPKGVRVNAIAPTGVKTGIRGEWAPDALAAANEFFKTQYHPMGVGLLAPEDIAGAAVFLASDASHFVNGAVIDVTAGASARYTG